MRATRLGRRGRDVKSGYLGLVLAAVVMLILLVSYVGFVVCLVMVFTGSGDRINDGFMYGCGMVILASAVSAANARRK